MSICRPPVRSPQEGSIRTADAIAAGVVAADKGRAKDRAKAMDKVKDRDRDRVGGRDKAGGAAMVTASNPDTSRGLIRGWTPGRRRDPHRGLSLLRRSTASRLRLRRLPRTPYRPSRSPCR